MSETLSTPQNRDIKKEEIQSGHYPLEGKFSLWTDTWASAAMLKKNTTLGDKSTA